MKTKTYTIRYYIPRIGADETNGNIATLLDKVAAMPERVGKVREAGSMVHQVRIHSVNLEKTEYQATFVRFRDELPLVGSRSSSMETPPKLDDGDEVIEKNHFMLFVEESGIEVIAYQVSMEGSDITALARYFTFINESKDNAVYFDDAVTGDAFEQMRRGTLKSIEFEVAKPRSKAYAPHPDDTWTSDAMEFMSKTGATRFTAKIKTTSSKNSLFSEVKDKLALLLSSTQTKKLKIKLSEIDHPIDLFADRILDKVEVPLYQGRPDRAGMFTEMAAAKKANIGLEPYLAKGDEALN